MNRMPADSKRFNKSVFFPSPQPPVRADMTARGSFRKAARAALDRASEDREQFLDQETPLRKSAATPVDLMHVELSRLHDAFQKSEGRSPRVDDADYWSVFQTIIRRRVGGAQPGD